MEKLLAKSQAAVRLATQFEGSQPDWLKVEDTVSRLIEANRRQSSANVIGLLGEACMRLFLDEAACSSKGQVLTPSIHNGEETGDYKFLKRNGRVSICRRRGTRWAELTDIDALTQIGDEVYLWECKLNHNVKLRGNIRSRIKLPRVAQIIKPIRDHFKLPVGFVLVVAPGLKNPNGHEQQDFMRTGGIISEFPAPRTEVKQRALVLSQKYHLHIDPSMLASPGKVD